MSPIKPHHVIAIGASAGGMEEINSFFDHTPLDGVSYVIVQHLSSDFKSRMSELLARHSKLIIKEAENEMPVKTNEVYLIPHDKFMTINNNKLYLSDKSKIKGPHLTINKFFSSLAADKGKKAIGIILSGLGYDGTDGIIDIKKAGGMIMARDPEKSEYNSMPSNAIATGLVDFILEPAMMPEAIEEFVKNEEISLVKTAEEEKYIAAIVNVIKEQSPLNFSDYKPNTIIRRIRRRATVNNFISLQNYLDFLKVTPVEVEALYKDFLIGVTSFFRDKEAFEFIESDLLPGIFNKLKPREELKCWVAGCATGEEAYSIAILIFEQLKSQHKDIIVKIFATDIDSVALVHAGKGVYGKNIEQQVCPERLEKHFIKTGGTYEVKSHIRKMVIFSQHDLVKNPPYSNMHLISCRNLLIYMTPILQKKIFFMLLFGLKLDGYLFIGPSENPVPIMEHLDTINKKWKIYRNLETKKMINFEGFVLPQMIDIKNYRTPFSSEEIFLKSHTPIGETVFEALITERGSLVICVDEDNNVVKSYGDTTKYLYQKNFSQNLSELLPRQLAIVFNASCIAVRKDGVKVEVKGIVINHNDILFKASLSVSLLHARKHEKQLLMVTFTEDKELEPAGKENYCFNEKTYADKYTLMLEEELNDLKDKLNSTYQQLDASNDNMQSYNEELLSANEEMQSTNEEMQSVNEELHTINSAYQLKNKELLDLNDDLNNYFRSNINGQLFVNKDMLLMKFSPGTVNLINLVQNDIGRPLSHISTNIKLDTIIPDIKVVLEKGTIISKEIETDKGKWYQVMTMPYLQQPNNITTGAIITFNDITEIKKTQLELDKKNKSLLRINADLDNFVLTASHDLLAPLGNIELSIGVMNEIKVQDPDLNKSLSIINSSVKKFRTLIQNISLIAKIESQMITMETVDIGELINEIEWALSNKIILSGATIIRNLKVQNIHFSKKNFRSILYNLISNSIKFSGNKPPVINIDTVQENDHIVLSVQDNGRGMAKDNLERIFDMYGRLNSDIEGQGIGLYLAKKIIDAANGNFIVESEPGKGTRFVIYLKIETAIP